MAEPLVRPGTEADAPEVARIWEGGWREVHLGNVPDELVRVRTSESFRARARQRVPDTSVAEVAGVVAGFVMVDGEEVDQVYVDAGHRGSGVASLLLAEAARRVAAGGHDRAWLAVVSANARARRFYEREGWTDEGLFIHEAPVEGGTVPVECHRMVRDLAQA